MYHSRWKNSHEVAGFSYGKRLYKNGIKINFEKYLTKEKLSYSQKVIRIYEKYYPEIVEEIKGFAAGQKSDFEKVFAFLAGMYVFTYDTQCSMVAVSNKNGIFFARNSDFLTKIEKLADSALYKLDKGFSFVGNTTAMIEMEDGINEKGLACGLTFVYPTVKGEGFNAGFLVRYILEKCENTEQVKEFLEKVPIGSSQNIIAADRFGKILSAELNAKVKNIVITDNINYKTNHFVEKDMLCYNYEAEDDIFSHKRYETLKKQNYLGYNLDDIFGLLKGEKGFLCQYNRTKGFDTIWSSVYDIKNKIVYRYEGNQRRKKFNIDKRLKFSY